MKNMPYKTACTNCLPDDGQKMFETRRRSQELNYNITMKRVHFHYITVSQFTAQKSFKRSASRYLGNEFIYSGYLYILVCSFAEKM